MRSRDVKKLTPVQLEIMSLFWDRGELGVAEVWKAISQRREVARNTVQTLLTRLAAKGWLKSRADGNTFYFRATQPRKKTVTGMLGDLLHGAFGGSAAGLIMTLLEEEKISKDDADAIRKMIDKADEKK